MFGWTAAAGSSALLASEIYTPHHLLVLAICAGLSFWRYEVYDFVADLNWTKALVLAPLFLLAVAAMFTQSFNPFLYFQF
jgi:alginate O-acetyltransferase complex protein AlgI